MLSVDETTREVVDEFELRGCFFAPKLETHRVGAHTSISVVGEMAEGVVCREHIETPLMLLAINIPLQRHAKSHTSYWASAQAPDANL